MNLKTIKAWPVCVAFAIASVTSSVGVAQSADVPSPCAGVTDDKSRLQCYDAEAKLRAGKALPAASATVPPPARAPAPALAAPAPAPAAPAPAAASASAPSTPAPIASASPSPSEFGKINMSTKRRIAVGAAGSTEPEQMSARVTAISQRLTGDYRIELDNGQVWVKNQGTGGEAPEVGETVTLRQAMMGSYLMSRDVGGLALRVKRVK